MKYKVKKDLAFRRIAGELFVVDAAACRLHELNGPAALVWEGLAAGKTESGIVSAITAEFDIDEETAREDAKAFILELSAAGLVSEHI